MILRIGQKIYVRNSRIFLLIEKYGKCQKMAVIRLAQPWKCTGLVLPMLCRKNMQKYALKFEYQTKNQNKQWQQLKGFRPSCWSNLENIAAEHTPIA